jgi:hypothetical protein
MPVLAFGAAAFGVVGLPAVSGWWARLVGDPRAAAPAIGELALSGASAVVVVLVVARVRLRAAPQAASGGLGGVLRAWLFLERGALALVWRPVMALARALAWFDDHVLDAAVNAVPRAGLAAARIAGSPFEVGLDGAVRAVAGAAGRLGALARRPQTGQVHTYFAQAAVALIVLAVAFAILR